MASENPVHDPDSLEEADQGVEQQAAARPTEAYEPWNDSYSMALMLAGSATLLVWGGFIMQRFFDKGAVGAIILSLSLAGLSIAVYIRGTSREFGKVFEEKYVAKAKAAFEGTPFKIIPNRMTRVGDVDLLVEGSSERLANVEIKSWRSYGDNDKFVRREKKALGQIHAQRGAVEADVSVLWLPQSRESFMKLLFNPFPRLDDEIYLCRGNARRLRKLLSKVLK